MFTDLLAQPCLIGGTALPGVSLQMLTRHGDGRGGFTEVFQQAWAKPTQFVQWSYVQSAANVFRGMHFHQRHDELFCLLSGHCLVGLYDLRPGSPTQHQSVLYEFNATEPTTLLFPPGLLHGWYFLAPSLHLQAVSEAYSDYGDDDNYGCQWNDPALHLQWPINTPLLSDRAAAFPSLQQLITTLTSGGWFDTVGRAAH